MGVGQGSDDRIIKVWSSQTGLLVATLRGHLVRRLHLHLVAIPS